MVALRLFALQSLKTVGLPIVDNIIFSYFLHTKIINLSLKAKNIELKYRGCLDFLFF